MSNVKYMDRARRLVGYNSKSELLKEAVNSIYIEIEDVMNARKQKMQRTKYRPALKNIILNLYYNKLHDVPTAYSRAESNYSNKYISYSAVINVADILEQLGYINQKIGWLDRKTGRSRQTRMWATERFMEKLRSFLTPNKFLEDFYLESLKEPLVLRGKKVGKKRGRNKKFKTTTRTTRMSDDILLYNRLADMTKVEVKIDDTTVINTAFLLTVGNRIIDKRYTLKYFSAPEGLTLNEKIFERAGIHKSLLEYNNNTGYGGSSKQVNREEEGGNKVSRQSSITHNKEEVEGTSYIVNNSNIITRTSTTSGFFSETHGALGENVTTFYYNNLFQFSADLYLYYALLPTISAKREFRKEKHTAGDLGIQQLDFLLNLKSISRIFNENWSKGGRAYSDIYQSFNSALRKNIYIAGEETVELDYSGLHIRMLYHLEGLDFEGDTYDCGDSYRELYKTASLILINAASRKEAVGAIAQDVPRLKGGREYFDTTKDPSNTLINSFARRHKKISKYLHSGIGLKLQNIDSNIMHNILKKLRKLNILGLTIHDSIIVQKQHKELLHELMLEEYEKELGFKPVIH